jgi:nicotinate phosphoribosyltransferase
LLLEFGLRRAQDKGANAGARAALIGGADFSSNTGISHVLGYPPKGTHAHSMVQIFMALGEGELGAFHAYKVFEELRRKGHEPVGIRLDSGDLAYLSIQAAKMLDAAGFPDTSIVLSNQLDELVIWQIISQIQEEAPRYGVDPDHLIDRLTYGVGTRLITSEGASALDGVYKLVAVCDEDKWVPAIKISETPTKTLNPGHKHVWRVYDQRGKATTDLLGLNDEDPREMERILLHHPTEHTKYRTLDQDAISDVEPLLLDVFTEGEMVYKLPSIEEMRERRQADIERLDPGVRRLMNPHTYHVSLTKRFWDLKQELIQSAKRRKVE